MTGFKSKRQVSLDTLDHMPYQGRETRPEELAPQPVPAVDHTEHVREMVPPGYVLVPVEATKAMCVAAVKLYNGDAVYKNVLQGVLDIEEEIYAEVYESMIAAAPVFEEHDMDDDGGCPVCGADGGTSCGMPNCGLLSAAPAVQSAARAIAAEQAEDTGLWFVATTVSEAHLQAALRRLTAAVEGEAP